MILHFRTKRGRNGNCKYLGIDTGAECYAIQYGGWVHREFAEIKVKDYRELIEQCERNGFKRIDRMS